MSWLPQGARASSWDEVKVPGMELYVVSGASKRSWGAARVVGASDYLRGKEAFDATRQRIGNDAVMLAGLAMLFLDEGAAGQAPWTRIEVPHRVPEQQAIAAPPSLSGDTLEYWRFHEQLADMVRCRVSLAAGTVQCELGGKLLHAQQVAANPMAVIEADLAADDIHRRIRGIQELEKLNTEEARTRLVDLALNQRHYRVREAAVQALGRTGERGQGVVEALSRVLLYDGYPEVRRAAAKALGILRDPAARDALQKAKAGDADGLVQVAAEQALKAL